MKVKLEMGKKWQVRSGIANLNTGRRKRCARWNCKRKKKVKVKWKKEKKKEEMRSSRPNLNVEKEERCAE